MGRSTIGDLDAQLLVALAYGCRARLQDLQKIADRELPNRLVLVGEANRLIRRVDERLLALAASDAVTGWALFDTIKASHDRSVQRLSQQLRDHLPDRAIIS